MSIRTESTSEEINIARVIEVNQDTIRHNHLRMVADAGIERVIKSNGGNANTLQPTARRVVDSINKAVYSIINGYVTFTAYASFDGTLSKFAIASLSRPKLYVVTENDCQCESHLHNGYCVHRTARQLLADYFTVIRADEDRARKYAKLGIKVTEITETFDASVDNFETLPPDVQEFLAEVELITGMKATNPRIIHLPAGGWSGQKRGSL